MDDIPSFHDYNSEVFSETLRNNGTRYSPRRAVSADCTALLRAFALSVAGSIPGRAEKRRTWDHPINKHWLNLISRARHNLFDPLSFG